MDYRPGDLRRTGRGQEVEVVAPSHCGNGHPLEAGRTTVGTELCVRGAAHLRHMTWTCLRCGDVTVGDGHPDACRG